MITTETLQKLRALYVASTPLCPEDCDGIDCAHTMVSEHAVYQITRAVPALLAEIERLRTLERHGIEGAATVVKQRDRAIDELTTTRQHAEALEMEVKDLKRDAKTWSCPACAFTFCAYHTNQNSSLTCPLCELMAANDQLTTTRQQADDLRKLSDAQVVCLNTLNDDVTTAIRERDAYRKAKQENDERFMNERDEARVEIERLTDAKLCGEKVCAHLVAERDKAMALAKERYDDRETLHAELGEPYQSATVSGLRRQLAAVRGALEEACDIAERELGAYDHPEDYGADRIAALRKAGQ